MCWTNYLCLNETITSANMLVNFYIHPSAIDNDVDRSHIKALRNKWQQFGALVHPSHRDGAFRSLRRKFSQLGQENQSLWNAAWQEIENDPVRFLKYRAEFEVALISQQIASNEDIPDGGGKCVRGVEAIRFTQINDSKKFRHAEELSRRRIEIGEKATDIWQERFQRLANHVREVVIVDQFAVRDSAIQGLTRFLNLLEEHSNRCNVTIYSSPEQERPEVVEAIRSELGNLTCQFSSYGINSLEVRLRSADDFRRYAHERHIRFDNRVVLIGRGMQIFQFDAVRQATRPSFNVLTAGETDGTETDLHKAYKISDFYLPIGTSTP